MRLRTLHFTNSWHATSGGIGTFYRALLDAANAAGWHTRLVVPSEETRFESTGPTTGIYHVRAPRAPFSPEYRVLYPHTYLLPSGPIRRILRQEQPHVVEICDKYTLPYLGGLLRVGALRETAGRPAVIGLSCERVDETLSVYSRAGAVAKAFAQAYVKCLYFPLSDHHIAVSRHVADELEDASHGHKVTRGVWIRGMGVDTVRFHPGRKSAATRSEIEGQCGAAKEDTLLLYAGRLALEKNLPLLLNLVTGLKKGPGRFKLLIAGDGPQREAFLQEAAERHPESIVYLGHISDRVRLADVMANVDAFLHPNPEEPYGIAPLEAMAAGAPLIAPDSGGVTTYANSSNAWVVPATPEAFCGAVRTILANPEDREARTVRARATAERLAWPEACAAYLSLYRELHMRVRALDGVSAEEPEVGAATEVERLQEPAFYSTIGNWLGFETPAQTATGKSDRQLF